jgi:hypothetical protein
MLKTLTAFLVLGGLHLAIAKDAGGKGKCRDSALQIVPGAAWTAVCISQNNRTVVLAKFCNVDKHP